MSELLIRPIAHLHCDLPEKFGIPRQAGIVEALEGTVVFEPEYRDPAALRGFSHIWLIWQFSRVSQDGWSPTVRPPRLGGNVRMGVFATRSPFRPNALGLSCVRLLGVEKEEENGWVLRVAGADLMDGTPIFDIKPYLPYADCRPEAASGFAPDAGSVLQVQYAPGTEKKLPPEKLDALSGVLANDPRPRYQTDPQRIYGMRYAGLEVRFRVEGETLTVVGVEEAHEA